MKRVAFLAFKPKNQRRKNNSFDGNDNIGAKVIVDVLRRTGIPVSYVTPESARYDADIVLISLTSTHDVYALLAAVSRLPSWRPGERSFTVVAGGFGMQNPTAIRSYVDYACFGRAHEWIEGVIRDVSMGKTPHHESVMDTREFNPVTIYQGGLYPHEVDGFKETFTGCPNKCKYCQFTFSRQYLAVDGRNEDVYSQGLLTRGASQELMWKSLLTLERKAGRLRVAIDGLSERLRYLYGKHISNDEIVAGIERVGSFTETTATVLLVYNIVNFPGETEDDYEEFVETVSRANPKNRVIFVLHSTPFRPSLATPMQWEPVSLSPNWSTRRAEVIIDRPKLRVINSFTLESAWTHAQAVIAERAQPEDDEAINAIMHSPRLRSAKSAVALRMFDRHYPLTKWTAERDIEGVSIAPFLRGYTPDHVLKKIASKLRITRESWVGHGR